MATNLLGIIADPIRPYSLNNAKTSRLIHDCVISMGTVNASLITPREIFSEALKFEAVSIVLLHNHPSGDATPSRNDIEVTRRIAQAGSLLGINLIDHIVIGDNAYTSLREKEFM